MRDYPKHVLRVYDDGSRWGLAQYAVYYRERGSRARFYQMVSMSEHPFHPQGVGQHAEGMLGRHNGKLINFADLPADCQKLVLSEA